MTRNMRNTRTEESDGLATVEETVVVGEGDNHDRTDDDLAVNNDGAVFNGVHACIYA